MNKTIRSFFKEPTQKITLRPQEYLFRQAEEAQFIYCVDEGSAFLYKQNAEDKIVSINFAKKGQCLGLETIQTNHYAQSAKATDMLQASCVRVDFIKELVKNNAELKFLVLQEFCHIISNAENKRFKILNKSTKERIASVLKEMLESLQIEYVKGNYVEFPHLEVANLLGISEKKVEKTLHQLQNEGLIAHHGNKIKIMDFNAFAGIA